MGLIANGTWFGGSNRMLGGSINAFYTKSKTSLDLARTYKTNKSSFPYGYHDKARILPVSAGGISCRVISGGVLSLDIYGLGLSQSTISGIGSLVSDIAGARNGEVNLSGSGSISCTAKGNGIIECRISIGAQPSVFDIVQAVLNATTEQYSTPGTIGEAITSGGGGSGGGWDMTIDNTYSGNQAGALLKKIADKKEFLDRRN